jgi:murein DD-endopeptidase MepM/ murein hydrolase activator NlpD
MPRIEKTEAKRGAMIALAMLVSFLLAACSTDPSPRTYLDWHTEGGAYHPIAMHERAPPPEAHRSNWPSATYYTVVVRPHDSVSTVASRYDVPESSVRRMNNIGAHDSVHAGDVLRIPPGSERTRETVLREADSRKIYAQPRDTDYVEEHPLSAPIAPPVPVRAAHAVPTPRIAPRVPDEEQASYEASGDMRFVWPVSGGHVISNYGASANGERNDGINIAASEGASIRAAAAGTVTYAGNELRQYGNLIIIKHADGYITVYAHEASIRVNKGDQVSQGQVIGTAGATGGVQQPEVHFEVRYQTKPVNPRPLLSETVARASS